MHFMSCTCNQVRFVVVCQPMDDTDENEKPFEVMEQAGYIPRAKRRKDGFSRQDVVNAFQDAFDIMGGTTRLALWANQNPDKFYPLYAKLLPSTAVVLGQGVQQRIIHAIPRTALDHHPGEVVDVEIVEQAPEELPRDDS